MIAEIKSYMLHGVREAHTRQSSLALLEQDVNAGSLRQPTMLQNVVTQNSYLHPLWTRLKSYLIEYPLSFVHFESLGNVTVGVILISLLVMISSPVLLTTAHRRASCAFRVFL
jgi:hypothetical protein